MHKKCGKRRKKFVISLSRESERLLLGEAWRKIFHYSLETYNRREQNQQEDPKQILDNKYEIIQSLGQGQDKEKGK